jgi:hypothetical protein
MSAAISEKRLGRSNITPGSETKVHGVSRTIHRSVQTDPFAVDLDVRLVDTPRRPGRAPSCRVRATPACVRSISRSGNMAALARGLGRYILAVPMRKVKEIELEVLTRGRTQPAAPARGGSFEGGLYAADIRRYGRYRHWCTCRRRARLPQTPSYYAMTGGRRTESGRPVASIRFSTATPMAASVC